jgi:6-phosphogluconolactonase
MKQSILFGGYIKRIGQDISCITLDAEQKSFTNLRLITKESNPTYLAVRKNGHTYSVDALNGAGELLPFA